MQLFKTTNIKRVQFFSTRGCNGVTNEELVQIYQDGNKQALNELIEKNTGMVYKLVNKFYVEGTNSIDREDLEQEGFIGLMIAADRYRSDNEHPCKFITYAAYWIYQKIHRFMKQKNTNDEMSLNTPEGDGNNKELMDYIEGVDYSFENVEERIYMQQLHAELDQVMNEKLTLRQREIIWLHYGWDNNKCMTHQAIADIFNVTRQRIYQLETHACIKIRNTSWARNKAIGLYVQKKEKAAYSISGTVESISFAERYLY